MMKNWLAAGALALAAVIAIGVVGSLQAESGRPRKEARKMELTVVDVPGGREAATLGNGCFWCTEAVFKDLRGVEKVTSGYSGGEVPNPTYKEVCSGSTGHAEAIQVIFDPKTISYKDLLRIFFTTHDPTTLNRQGADSGTQYRSAIFTHSEDQTKAANEVIAEITKEELFPNKIVTDVTPFTNFYPAEDYHQNYYELNPYQGYCQVVIAPKVAKFREKYREMLKK